MSVQQAVFALLTAILPILGIILPGIFKQDKLSMQVNGFIATGIIIVVAALQAWSEGQLNLINPWLDFGIVLTGISALLAGPFKGVDLYLQSNVGPGAKQPAPVTPAQNQTIDLVNSLISVLSQHGQALSALLPFLQTLATSIQSAQPAPTVAPVHGPSTGTAAAQPSQDGVQASIAPFTVTSEQPAVQPAQ